MQGWREGWRVTDTCRGRGMEGERDKRRRRGMEGERDACRGEMDGG